MKPEFYNLSLLPKFDCQFKNKSVDIKELAQRFKQQDYLNAFEDKYKHQPVLLNQDAPIIITDWKESYKEKLIVWMNNSHIGLYKIDNVFNIDVGKLIRVKPVNLENNNFECLPNEDCVIPIFPTERAHLNSVPNVLSDTLETNTTTSSSVSSNFPSFSQDQRNFLNGLMDGSIPIDMLSASSNGSTRIQARPCTKSSDLIRTI